VNQVLILVQEDMVGREGGVYSVIGMVVVVTKTEDREEALLILVLDRELLISYLNVMYEGLVCWCCDWLTQVIYIWCCCYWIVIRY
jgi:hypothetical protein